MVGAANSPFKTTSNCIEFLKTQTDEVVLFYSGGKDSICLVDILSKHFKVNLAHMYLVNNIEHIERYLVWAEKKYKCRVLKYPHWMLSSYTNDAYLRFHSEKVSNIKLSDIENKTRKDFNCEWIINGMKKSDSLNRRLMLNTYFMQSVNIEQKKAFPLSDWNKKMVLSYIATHNLPKPISYTKNERSSGLDLTKECLSYVKENFPNDFSKILNEFPFAEILIYGNK